RDKRRESLWATGQLKLILPFALKLRGPDFNISLRTEDTDMRTMNDLFRAYGNFDVGGGVFSLCSEIKVRQGKIEGYVKPLFRDVNVYDDRQDREKSGLRKLYEGLGGGSRRLRQTPTGDAA